MGEGVSATSGGVGGVGVGLDGVAVSGGIHADQGEVGDGDDVFGMEIINTPGHTPGSIAMLDRGIGLLIAGDAINGNEAGTAVTGPNPDFSANMDDANASVLKLAEFPFDSAAFGHGNPIVSGAGDQLQELARSLG